jgi:hypothetical protein
MIGSQAMISGRIRGLALSMSALVVLSLTGGSADARAHRWSHRQCNAAYAGWVKGHRHASPATKQAEQRRLNHTHGCSFHVPTAPSPLVPLTSLGATEEVWRTRHTVDPLLANAFDPEPGVFPGSFNADKYFVTFTSGLAESYFVKFPPGSTQSVASALVQHELPTDTKLVVLAKNLGACSAEELESRSVGAAEQGRYVVLVTYDSYYDLNKAPYDAASVLEAYVTATHGPPLPAGALGGGSFGSLICG